MGSFSLDTRLHFNFELCESVSIQKVKLQIHFSERQGSGSQYQINSTYWQCITKIDLGILPLK